MKWRAWWCIACYGSHDFYKAWSRERLYQKCLRCGHESRGWDVRPSFRYWSTWMR